jgi:hypothetical protein
MATWCVQRDREASTMDSVPWPPVNATGIFNQVNPIVLFRFVPTCNHAAVLLVKAVTLAREAS